MKQLTIFVDMDGTIERLLDVWLAKLNKIYNRNVCFEDVTSWDMTSVYSGLTMDEVLSPLSDGSIWAEVQPMDGASEVLRKWYLLGHRVYIVTATPYQSVVSKMEGLLFRCFPFITWKNVIITENKQLLKGDVMIDDGVHNLIGGDYEKLLFDAPYNRDINDRELGIIRVRDWYEIDDRISELSDN